MIKFYVQCLALREAKKRTRLCIFVLNHARGVYVIRFEKAVCNPHGVWYVICHKAVCNPHGVWYVIKTEGGGTYTASRDAIRSFGAITSNSPCELITCQALRSWIKKSTSRNLSIFLVTRTGIEPMPQP